MEDCIYISGCDQECAGCEYYLSPALQEKFFEVDYQNDIKERSADYEELIKEYE